MKNSKYFNLKLHLLVVALMSAPVPASAMNRVAPITRALIRPSAMPTALVPARQIRSYATMPENRQEVTKIEPLLTLEQLEKDFTVAKNENKPEKAREIAQEMIACFQDREFQNAQLRDLKKSVRLKAGLWSVGALGSGFVTGSITAIVLWLNDFKQVIGGINVLLGEDSKRAVDSSYSFEDYLLSGVPLGTTILCSVKVLQCIRLHRLTPQKAFDKKKQWLASELEKIAAKSSSLDEKLATLVNKKD